MDPSKIYYCLSAAINETATQVGRGDKRYNDEKNAVKRKRNGDFTSNNSAAGDLENNSAHYTFGSMGCWSYWLLPTPFVGQVGASTMDVLLVGGRTNKGKQGKEGASWLDVRLIHGALYSASSFHPACFKGYACFQ
jgi:hypothetical protein